MMRRPRLPKVRRAVAFSRINSKSLVASKRRVSVVARGTPTSLFCLRQAGDFPPLPQKLPFQSFFSPTASYQSGLHSHQTGLDFYIFYSAILQRRPFLTVWFCGSSTIIMNVPKAIDLLIKGRPHLVEHLCSTKPPPRNEPSILPPSQLADGSDVSEDVNESNISNEETPHLSLRTSYGLQVKYLDHADDVPRYLIELDPSKLSVSTTKVDQTTQKKHYRVFPD